MIKFRLKNYFTVADVVVWSVSVALICLSFFVFDRENYLTFIASLIGITAIVLNAKGNPLGMILMFAFAFIYGFVSYGFRYYGEMATYIGMSAPMCIVALVAWLKNPYKNKRSEVKINAIKKREVPFIILLTAVVTVAFYFILKYLGTANLIISTISVTSSFAAAYLTFRRSPYFALVYAINDLILIVMWFMATAVDSSYLSVAICFIGFLISDLYGFISWIKRQKIQEMETNENG